MASARKALIHFKKVFHGCPLKINCSTNWEHPVTNDLHLIIGADEGIYTLNLNSSEATMELLFPGRCSWLFQIHNVLMSVSGKSSQLHCHLLKDLHEQARREQRLPTHRLLHRKLGVSTKVPDTKGCRTCTAGSLQGGAVVLVCALDSSVVLLQWYEPMRKFMLIKTFDFPLPSPLRLFQMVLSPGQEYPLVCFGLSRGPAPLHHVTLQYMNLNSNTSWFSSTGLEKSCPESVQLKQLDSERLLVLLHNAVSVVGLEGELLSQRGPAQHSFTEEVEAVVLLDDSLLSVWRHGWSRRGPDFSEILEETTDHKKTFRLIPSHRLVLLETRREEELLSNLYLLSNTEGFLLQP